MGIIDSLSLGTSNATVTAFKALVDYNLGKASTIINSEITDYNTVNTANSNITEFDIQLYIDALKLPECQNISFDYIDNINQKLIGEFSGAKVFKTFSGDIVTTIDNPINKFGQAILDNQTLQYALFTNNDESLIIAFEDFTAEPLISDFTELYYNLLTSEFNSTEVYNDVNTSSSLTATFNEYTSNVINNNITQKTVENTYNTISSYKDENIQENLITLPVTSENSITTPNNINEATINKIKDTSVATTSSPAINQSTEPATSNIQHTAAKEAPKYELGSVQAIIFDIDHKYEPLICYQLPENISYSVSSQYDSIATRGSQQPFQFYNNTNQITLSFSLKWHIDEIISDNHYSTLQMIADAAENFVRPYKENESLKPKVCGVILPSISHIGYITEAQITYSGAITSHSGATKGPSDLSNFIKYSASYDKKINYYNEDDITGGEKIEKTKLFDETDYLNPNASTYATPAIQNTSYEYSILEISFQLIIIKDIILTPSKKETNDKLNADIEQRENEAQKQLNEDLSNADSATKAHADMNKMQSRLDDEPKNEAQVINSINNAKQYLIQEPANYILTNYGTWSPVQTQGELSRRIDSITGFNKLESMLDALAYSTIS